MARRLKTIARWVNQNLGQYGYRATVNSKDYNYSVGSYYGGNVVGYHGSRSGNLFQCWELTDLEDKNDEPNTYRRRDLKTFRDVGGIWRKIKSHNSAEPYRNNTQVENFVRGLVAKVRRENPDAEVVDYEAEDFEAEIKYDGAKRYLRGLSTRFEGANNEGFFPADEEDFEDMVVDEIGEHTEFEFSKVFGAEKYGGLMMGDEYVEVNLTGLEHYQVGFDNFGYPLHRLDKESQKELINRINRRAKQRRSKKGQEEARLKIKLRKDNDFTFIMGDEYADFSAEELASEFTGMKRDSKRDYARRGMKRHYERMGMIPSPIGLAAYRRKIEVPKGFKYAQLGFLALVFGAFTVSEMRKRE